MKNRNPKIVEIIDDIDLVFKCKKCGQIWYPDSNKISWQCPNGCRVMNKQLMEKVKKYIKLLMNKSKEIKEVYLIGSLATGNFNKNSDIDLVICFNKDPSTMENITMALETVLKWESELAKEENKLKIRYPIDLGFVTGSDIFLGGLISDYDFNAKYITFTQNIIGNINESIRF
jgi:predicted nucleotidyltransferase